jgi:transcriptional regulator with XRE-family HTH domain
VSVSVVRALYPEGMLVPAQARAARALLGWKQTDLASETGLKVQAIKLFEAGKTDPRASTVAAIEQAFDRAGVIFLDPGEMREGGAGLRLKQS